MFHIVYLGHIRESEFTRKNIVPIGLLMERNRKKKLLEERKGFKGKHSIKIHGRHKERPC